MTDATTAPTTTPPSPWDRFGWVMGGIWLVFLAFPLTAVFTSDLAARPKITAITVILVFGAVYVFGFVRLNRARGQRWERWLFLAVLALLTLGFGFIIGTDALGMMPYLVAFTMFTQPVRRAFAMTGGWLLLTLVLLLVSETMATRPVFLLIPFMVAVITGLIRWIDDRQDRHLSLERDLNLVAERERVARDVHDVLGHSLTVITVKSELAERLVDVDPEAAKAELAQIRSMTREALAEIRATVAGLRVARLADELASARAALTDAGIAADVPAEADVVDPRHRLVLAWVLREAVTNVVRHSEARRCTVELGTGSLVVMDDGVGPGPALIAPSAGLLTEARGSIGLSISTGPKGEIGPTGMAAPTGVAGPKSGTGLKGVAERVRGAGGTLSISTAEGGGTRLEVHW